MLVNMSICSQFGFTVFIHCLLVQGVGSYRFPFLSDEQFWSRSDPGRDNIVFSTSGLFILGSSSMEQVSLLLIKTINVIEASSITSDIFYIISRYRKIVNMHFKTKHS